MKNGVKIISIEGSEILKNNLEGMSIKKNYKAVFADSLLLDKLRTLNLNVASNDSTRDIIALNFTYGYTGAEERKLIDEMNKNKKLIDSKYDLKQLKIAEENNYKQIIKEKISLKKLKMEQRKQIQGNKDKKPLSDEISVLSDEIKKLKDDNFISNEVANIVSEIKVLKDKNKELYEEIKSLKMDNEAVRDKLYNEGFYLEFYKQNRKTKVYSLEEKIFYKFWFRSPSKSRTGNVCFINENLLNNIRSWQRMGLKLPDNDECKLVEMLAYESLTASHIESYLHIDVDKELLVVNDLDSYFETMCAVVKVKKKINIIRKKHNIIKCNYNIKGGTYKEIKEIGQTYVKNEMKKIKNTLFDGMAIGDDSYFTGRNGMKVLRQHFFKTCMFRGKVKLFFKRWCKANGKDYKTYKVKDRYGNEILIKNVKIITTENSLKIEKFKDIGASYDYWKQKVKEDNCQFGVCKIDHISKYNNILNNNDDIVRCYQRHSYQHINSLPIDMNQAKDLCKDTVEYVNSMKDNNDLFINYLKRTKSDVNSNEMIISLFEHNKEFENSKFFRKYKSKTLSEYKEILREGKILVEGDNLTVCGNPMVLLYHAVEQVPYTKDAKGKCILNDDYRDETLPVLKEGISVYTRAFPDKTELASLRNPHNSFANIGYNINFRHELMETYFNFSNNIMAINCIKTDEQDKKNSEDFDSDFNMVTCNETVVQASKIAQKYNTIVNDIPESGKKYRNTMTDIKNIDATLATGKYNIGLSSNLAQLALSWYWNNPTQELEDIVSIASVLAQVAIDSSKRQYEIDLIKEISRIRKLDCMQVRIKDGQIVQCDPDATIEEKKEFKKLLSAKPYFWQFVKEIKEQETREEKYKTKLEKDREYTEEELKQIKADDKEKTFQLNLKAKQDARKKKIDKEDKMKDHCINERICPMDYIQYAIDEIKVDISRDKCTDDFSFIKVIEGDSDNKQREKVKKYVKELDDFYHKHFDLVSKNEAEDDEDWQVEQLMVTEETVNKIKKLSIKPKTMQMLLVDAFGSNKKYKRRLLNCLYKAHKDLFLQGFKVTN